jgi:hypothetical protein
LKIPNVLEVIYAPHKAFKKLGEKPNYIGPAIIIAVLVVANLGFAYMALSKTYLETSMPNGQNQDEWTQNSTLWTASPNATVSVSNDSITGAYYGNESIAFSKNDTMSVWMQLDNIGPVNCSSQSGFNQLSFRLKQLSPYDKPQNVSLYLNSTNATSFSYDLTNEYSNSSVGTWYNVTEPLVSGWTTSNSNADWSNITGFRLEFSWTRNSNASLLVDGLFFHGIYQSWLDQVGTGYMLSFALTSVMQFVITWVIFSGLLFLIGRTLGGKVVWRLILVAVGLILITLVVQALINVASYTTLSQLNYPFSLVGGVQGEGTQAYNTILDQTATVRMITSIAQVAIWAWTIALGALLLRFTAELAWLKSILAAVAAYIVTLLVSSFLFG